MAEAGGNPILMGIRIAMPAVGPTPGRTPMRVPTRAPMKQRPRLVALTPTNLGLCFIGALVGTLIGVLPGVGPTAGIAILIPISIGLPPASAIILLTGIYYGAMYG